MDRTSAGIILAIGLTLVAPGAVMMAVATFTGERFNAVLFLATSFYVFAIPLLGFALIGWGAWNLICRRTTKGS